jgi:hypothetical protein
MLALFLGITFGHVAEYICIKEMGADATKYFIPVSLTFHLVPFVFLLEANIRATRQKMKLVDTLKTFKIANTKCFDPKDRTVVERAISSWFSTGSSTGRVDTAAIQRFEEDVREGLTNRRIMASIGTQPGLLRVRDLLVALFAVWIPTTLDFCASNSPGNGLAQFCATVVVVAYAASLTASARVTELLFKCSSRWPSALLIPVLFIIILVGMMVFQNVAFIAMFAKCGEACIFL